MGCNCGGSPQTWQPASQAQNAPRPASDPNEAIRNQQQAAERGVWPRAWTGQRDAEKV